MRGFLGGEKLRSTERHARMIPETLYGPLEMLVRAGISLAGVALSVGFQTKHPCFQYVTPGSRRVRGANSGAHKLDRHRRNLLQRREGTPRDGCFFGRAIEESD